MDKENIEKMKQLLIDRNAALMAVAISGEKDAEPVILDQQKVGRISRIDAMQVQAMSAETNRRRGIELASIRAALERIEKGDYGYCVKCDEEITLKRLEIEPASPMCISCAELSEKR